MGTPVPLGDHTYTVVPQKMGRIRSRLIPQFRGLDQLLNLEGASVDTLLDEGMERAHALMLVFIPDLMPLHEFCGYSTSEAQKAGEYHEGSDHGPDFPQLRNAFETCLRVNSFDLLGHLKNFFSPELIRAVVQERLLDEVVKARESQTGSSTTTSSTSGPDLESTPSGTTLPISTANSG